MIISYKSSEPYNARDIMEMLLEVKQIQNENLVEAVQGKAE
jgi:hypothetical protein